MSSEKYQEKMYNLNVNVATNLPNFLGLDGQTNTPRTPDIVNSLITMNPFESLVKSAGGERNSPGSEESCSGTGSPLGSPTNSPPSVQHTRSQLIKEGLKLTIQTKRKQSGSDTKEDLEELESKRSKREELTAEDEERRKRRRERNKIAATKCRMKKREKTANLVNESELLETQNQDLKSQIHDLEKQKRKLMDMLSMHSPTCVKNAAGPATPSPSEPALAGAHQFQDYVTESETSYLTAFEGDGGFAAEPPATPADFEIGSTNNGTGAMNPYGKDPTFAKLVEVGAPASVSPSSPVSSSPSPTYGTAGAGGGGGGGGTRGGAYPLAGFHSLDYYHQRQKSSDGSTGVSYDFASDADSIKKSGKGYGKAGRGAGDKSREHPQHQQQHHHHHHEFRNSFHEDSDSYRPNGLIDGNFFANRADVFNGSEYATSFGASALDNGCMA